MMPKRRVHAHSTILCDVLCSDGTLDMPRTGNQASACASDLGDDSHITYVKLFSSHFILSGSGCKLK